jgi:hypothetical protein
MLIGKTSVALAFFALSAVVAAPHERRCAQECRNDFRDLQRDCNSRSFSGSKRLCREKASKKFHACRAKCFSGPAQEVASSISISAAPLATEAASCFATCAAVRESYNRLCPVMEDNAKECYRSRDAYDRVCREDCQRLSSISAPDGPTKTFYITVTATVGETTGIEEGGTLTRTVIPTNEETEPVETSASTQEEATSTADQPETVFVTATPTDEETEPVETSASTQEEATSTADQPETVFVTATPTEPAKTTPSTEEEASSSADQPETLFVTVSPTDEEIEPAETTTSTEEEASSAADQPATVFVTATPTDEETDLAETTNPTEEEASSAADQPETVFVTATPSDEETKLAETTTSTEEEASSTADQPATVFVTATPTDEETEPAETTTSMEEEASPTAEESESAGTTSNQPETVFVTMTPTDADVASSTIESGLVTSVTSEPTGAARDLLQICNDRCLVTYRKSATACRNAPCVLEASSVLSSCISGCSSSGVSLIGTLGDPVTGTDGRTTMLTCISGSFTVVPEVTVTVTA